MKLFSDVIKSEPSVGDVHDTSALDDEKTETAPDDEGSEDGVTILVTEKGAIEGFVNRRLEPASAATCRVPLQLAEADLQPTTPVLAALINQKAFVTKSVPIASLSFFDLEVDRSAVEKSVLDLADGTLDQPIVEKIGGVDHVIYGTAAVLARWLNGEDRIAVRYRDVEKREDALKIAFKLEKASPDQQLIFGWASVVTKDGKPVVDAQGHIIPVPELENAFYKYVLNDRAHGHMHRGASTGRLIECMVFTKEKQDLLKINLGFEGAWVGYLVDDAAVWAAHKRGELPEFSIGGFAVPVDV